MLLSDNDIRTAIDSASSNLSIEPYEDYQIQPASIDLRLGNDFKVIKKLDSGSIDSREDKQPYMAGKFHKIEIPPEAFILGTTMETINMPDGLLGRIEGRSSLGRLGIEIHKTAGVIDPGYNGEITLEITNDSPNPIVLHHGQRVCQMTLEVLQNKSMEPYDGKYNNQDGATNSRMYEDDEWE